MLQVDSENKLESGCVNRTSIFFKKKSHETYLRMISALSNSV